MASKTFEGQNNYGWGLTFQMTGKIPFIDKEIFSTLDDAEEFANDIYDSAIEGMLLRVVSDGDKNGVYFVKKIKKKEDNSKAELVKLSEGDLKDLKTEILNLIGDVELGENQTLASLITDINTKADSNKSLIDSTKETIDGYTINNKAISKSPVLDTDDLSIVDGYSRLDKPSEFILPGDSLTNAIGKIEIMLANTTLALTAAINDLENKIGNYTEYDDEGNVVLEGSGLMGKLEKLESGYDKTLEDYDYITSSALNDLNTRLINTENFINQQKDLLEINKGGSEEENQ